MQKDKSSSEKCLSSKTIVENKGIGQWFIQPYQFASSKDLRQPQQPIEPTHQALALKKEESKEKGEIEEKVAKTSRKTEKGNSPKLSTVKQSGQSNKIWAIKEN